MTTIHFTMNEAVIEAEMGADAEAEKSFRQLLELEHRVLGPNQPETAVTEWPASLRNVVKSRKPSRSCAKPSTTGCCPAWR
ncbi:hypothetical protein SBA2_340012 [Acidobacteriia bacterium SbA2]|nr:hypothetical protein SBA2_340012 [Acidobacteriia bacterium SbA2]